MCSCELHYCRRKSDVRYLMPVLVQSSLLPHLQGFLLVVICLGSYFGSSENRPFPDITDEKFINDCVRIHNDNRSSVNPPASNMLYMTWDEGLAITAKAWARHCVFEHNIYLRDVRRVHPVFSSVGENIWAGAPPSTFSVMKAMRLWVNEDQYYKYESNVCQQGKMCGHYTQVVWATSYKVGCAVQICPNGIDKTTFSGQIGAIFVCNYATAGNMNGLLPYQTGTACSACEGTNNQCQAKLCRDLKRDQLKSYSWTPDWDPVRATRDPSLATEDPNLTTCGSSCIAILALRFAALLLTFVTAFGVHRFYPSIFFYE
ncbi:glioma pathogenesis-related protein 1-like [Esox lucius]|uniref:glioma pathogenesis-related protein 1-like n=1 Tax=Esox lucius TaxID=8010 RepID=UPI00147710D7|nr:glioma pathogenesis-related protein 1-like [Esox lucius]